MVDWTLVASSLVASIASGCFLSVALTLREHRTSDEAREAITLFSTWWMALSVYAVVGGTIDLSAALGLEPFDLFVLFRYMQMFALAIGIWGLMYYLAYVLTGHRRYLPLLAVVFAVYYGALVFVITMGQPSDVHVRAWATQLIFETPLVDALTATLLLVLPPVVAAGTYLFLYFRAHQPTQRFRITLVSAGTLAWCASLVAREASWTAALPALLALVSAWGISWAYHPPTWVRRKLGAPREPAEPERV